MLLRACRPTFGDVRVQAVSVADAVHSSSGLVSTLKSQNSNGFVLIYSRG